MVQEKAEALLSSGEAEEKARARCALTLLEKSRDLRSIQAAGVNILYADEYRVRAEALVEARRLVGGVVLEKM